MNKTPYTEDELIKLEKAFLSSKSYTPNAGGEFIRIRDLYILKIACALGLRPAEALCLQWKNIDFMNGEIRINPYTNKERNPESIILNSRADQLLKQWKIIFDDIIKCDFVFPSLMTFEPISTGGYEKKLREISKEAGIYQVISYTKNGQPITSKSFYSARKYFGTKIFRNTKDIYFTMRALRQKTMRSIPSYVYYTKDEMKKTINNMF